MPENNQPVDTLGDEQQEGDAVFLEKLKKDISYLRSAVKGEFDSKEKTDIATLSWGPGNRKKTRLI